MHGNLESLALIHALNALCASLAHSARVFTFSRSTARLRRSAACLRLPTSCIAHCGEQTACIERDGTNNTRQALQALGFGGFFVIDKILLHGVWLATLKTYRAR